MLHKTLGIVLKTTAYGDSSVIAKIFTQKFGVTSYLINGVRTVKSKHKAALMQPLAILDLVVYQKENKNIQHIKEIKLHYIYAQIPFHVIMQSQVMFANELLNKVLHDHEPLEYTFDFIIQQLEYLDKCTTVEANWHLQFMLLLTQHLGFYPDIATISDSAIYFDLQNAVFVPHIPNHVHYATSHITSLFKQFIVDLHLPMNHIDRQHLIQLFQQFYKLHSPAFTEMKSPKILELVFMPS